VNEIINETNRNVQKLIDEGNSKVKKGVAIADRCGKVLDEVVDNAAIVKNMMNEVLVASKEQADGVRNITQAMNQLDQTTHANANSANRSFENSKELSLQAENLKKNVEVLEVEIFGGSNVYSIQKVKTEKPKNFDNVLPLKKEEAKHFDLPKKEITKFETPKPTPKPVAKASEFVAEKAKVEPQKKAEIIDIKHAKKPSETMTKAPTVDVKKPTSAPQTQKVEQPKKESTLSSIFGKKKTVEKEVVAAKAEAVKTAEVKKVVSESSEKTAKTNNLQVPSHNDPRFEDV
jgi:hypothetical protein